MAVNPSIQLGTSGNWAIKEDNLLAYKQLGNKFFNREFDFSRGTTATFIGEDGLIQESAIDVPRIDFSDSTNGALLLEPQRTNLVEYSEDGTQWDTVNSAVSLTTDSTSPSGQSSVYKVNDDATDAQHRVDARPSVTSGTEYAFSAFVKKPSGSDIDFAYLLFASNFSTTRFYFNIEEGTSLDSGGTIEDYGNGWYRLSANATANSSGNGVFGVNLSNANNNNTYSGTGNGSMFVWGIQVESNASYPTSYIPTSGAISTRSADVCNNSGSAQDFNSEEGVLYLEAKVKTDDIFAANCIAISDGTDTNRLSIIMYGNINSIRASMNVGGVSQFDFNLPSGYIQEQYYKIAVSYKVNDCKIFINGTKISTDTSATMPSLATFDRLSFDLGQGSYNFYGKVKDLQVFKRALTDEELQTLTT